MKQQIETLLNQAIEKLKTKDVLEPEVTPVIKITHTNDPKHGDFATNLALTLSKAAGMSPHPLAKKIVEALPPSAQITKVEIAGPGFINFFVTEESYQTVVSSIFKAGKDYGRSELGKGQRVYIEYVSANPTGPLHVGHGRGAAYGACVANLLKAAGFEVHQEYYVNDVGRQMGILALSVWVRYLQGYEASIELPKNAYQGEYIIDIAESLKAKYSKQFYHSVESIQAKIPEEIDSNADPEAYLDAWVTAQKDLLGPKDFDCVFQAALDSVLNNIKNDLEEFGVTYDDWFPESRLVREGLIQEGLNLLAKHGYVYEKNGAQWFRATALGDEKDRVLIRKNGLPTYFASDVAYHLHKFNQGYDQIIDIFGADHHGYIPRIRGFLKGLGKAPEKLHILLVQFAILSQGNKKVSMSTRGGTFVTLRELRHEVGSDAARFFYIMRKSDQHLNFDLELAKSQSNENPVYYIQYAHARICSVFRQLKTIQKNWDRSQGIENLYFLSKTYEKELLATLARYPEVIKRAATHYAPHLLARYLQSLANQFHTYYNAERFLIEDDKLRNARLNLISAVQQIIHNGLTLLGVSAPEEM
ncbi:arginine--tRNA ligase [Coxiella endosymbiont of Ornithodoros amblus]|uniref:arginine--tRNA ligase n=1 Tax=Coxiella endosymbiont of Ornithodoros amblus TaxID=1656166 RepID=UPI00244E27B9|nr:arginine--tRNA ligase [Coxiella endosymbiont of Ornithodoros amblus]MBW5802740.1 arginine--tRNA ligase [Coxiella endosymbiont of Ornithodoros amblus]